MSTHVGIDWGGKRWIVVSESHGDIEITTSPSLYTAWVEYNDADQILIDMPVGLPTSPEVSPRSCDEAAKEYLPSFLRNSVFDVPCPEAVRATDYSRAKGDNRSILNTETLSSQTWGIAERILEADVLMEQLDPWPLIRESHPEVCFQSLAEDELEYRKSIENGFKERRSILGDLQPELSEALDSLKHRVELTAPWKRRIGVSMVNDVVDAMVLALTAKLGTEGEFSILGGQKNDRSQWMEIVHYESELN